MVHIVIKYWGIQRLGFYERYMVNNNYASTRGGRQILYISLAAIYCKCCVWACVQVIAPVWKQKLAWDSDVRLVQHQWAITDGQSLLHILVPLWVDPFIPPQTSIMEHSNQAESRWCHWDNTAVVEAKLCTEASILMDVAKNFGAFSWVQLQLCVHLRYCTVCSLNLLQKLWQTTHTIFFSVPTNKISSVKKQRLLYIWSGIKIQYVLERWDL